jgi:hypothetical protein
MDLRGEYDLIVGLGVSCQVAHQLRRKRLRAFSGPLDWFISESLSHVTRMIERRFEGFMDLAHLQVQGEHEGNYRVFDTEYQCLSVHDFPRARNTPQRLESYPEFKAKIDRRAARLLAAMDDPGCSILFVRHFGRAPDQNCWNYLVHEFHALIAALRAQVRGPFRVLAATDSPLGEYVQGDWGVEQTGLVQMPFSPADNWEGCDADWDGVLTGIGLRGNADCGLRSRRPTGPSHLE